MKSAWLALGLILSASAGADERILSFDSDVRVLTDGTIEVTETIEVRAEGKQIRRGIYRDFPIEYRDRHGNNYEVDVEVLAVMRNGEPENYHKVRSNRDIRVYFGQSDRFIEPAVHTYTYRYRASRMLGFFEEHDELYWNVTGNRWAFPIDAASASITLDFDAPRDGLFVEAYTGRLGSNEQEYSRYMDEAGTVHFEAVNPLPEAHGLTIVVGWPKGFVVEPSVAQRLGWLLTDNLNLLIAVIGWLLLIAYYIPVWRSHGKDPEEGIIVTRYEPPQGFSPASLRYIRQMYYDGKVMTAAIVNLAVKGYLDIEDDGDSHTLRKKTSRGRDEKGSAPEGIENPLGSDPVGMNLAAGEKELLEALFADGDSVELKQANHKRLGKARSKHRESLQADYKQKYFKINGLLNVPGAIIVMAATMLALNTGLGPTALVIATIVLMFATLIFFAIVMKRPTIRGRKVLDEMLGFKDYIEVAEKDELNLRNPPEKTPQLFEAFLPFALALDVDQEWSEKFASVLAAIREPNGDSYSPSWYNGNWHSSNLAESTNSFTSGLNSAVSTSVAAPGSSSGGGGGGSSGGGGGGGGGGGW